MVIALLAILGVNLIVLVVFASSVLGRRRWLQRQPGAFFGAARVLDGELDGLGDKWRRGCGRWVRDVFVWEKGPFMIRAVLIPVDERAGDRTAQPGEVKRLGGDLTVTALEVGQATIEVAAKSSDRMLIGGGLPPTKQGAA